MLEQYSRFGRELFLQGVNSSHSGNMSVRAGDRISMQGDGIVPIDTEGVYYFKTVPVIVTGLTVGSDEVAEKLPQLLQNYKAAIVRGHGSFAVGQMLEEAFQWTSSLEASCKTLYLSRLLSPRGEEEEEGKW